MQKAPLRAPSTRASLFKFKSMHTEVSLVVVDGLIGRFLACVRIAADFPQQWPQSDHVLSHSSKLLLRVFSLARTVVFVGCEDWALYVWGCFAYYISRYIYTRAHSCTHTCCLSHLHILFLLSLWLSLFLSLFLSLSLTLSLSPSLSLTLSLSHIALLQQFVRTGGTNRGHFFAQLDWRFVADRNSQNSARATKSNYNSLSSSLLRNLNRRIKSPKTRQYSKALF